jgi:hypothetical protein
MGGYKAEEKKGQQFHVVIFIELEGNHREIYKYMLYARILYNVNIWKKLNVKATSLINPLNMNNIRLFVTSPWVSQISPCPKTLYYLKKYN